MLQWKKIVRAMQHRPFNSQSEQYKSFIQQTIAQIIELKKSTPYLEVQEEIEHCLSLIG
jgi:hypothetical protein